MKKRIQSLLLAVVLVFTLAVPVFAQSLSLTADKTTVKAGEDVTVTVSFEEAVEHITGVATYLYFNSDLFTYKEGESFDRNATIVKGQEGTAPNQYKLINFFDITADGTIAAGKFITCTFTAKENVQDLSKAEFKMSFDKESAVMMPGYEVPNLDDKILSVSVVPAYTGYGVTASAVNGTVAVGEQAQVKLTVDNADATTYNAYYMELSYDSDLLTYESINTDATVDATKDGTLKIAGYGADKTCGADNLLLTFAAKAIGEAKVTVTSAKVDASANAAEKDAPDAKILSGTAAITVGGYLVTLPDAFTGNGTANPGKDYTFTAKDSSKKYDFTGSTMGGKTVEVIDNGDGTYTVRNVSGELVIKATEKAGKVTINLSGDAVNTITQKSWGTATEVDAGTALWFMAQPETGKELVVTVNGEVVTGRNMQGFMRYDIAAGKVTGTELNIVVSYKAADKATIIESGTAWDKVGNLSRIGWTQSGDKVDAGATLEFFFKPETGKTIDDYMIRANGVDCTYRKVGGRYKVTIPAEIITAGATVTINFDYAATPEPTITVNVSEYLKLDNQSIFLVTASGDVAEGKVLTCNGDQMYWSSKYNAYAWLVISEKTLDEVKADVSGKIAAADGSKVEIGYTGDVNLTSHTDINDAQLVWNIYNAKYTDFQTVNIRKFLEADMNGDRTVNTKDAAAITALLFQ